jgi:glycosyltransferase involved in cell wall biosynthesis
MGLNPLISLKFGEHHAFAGRVPSEVADRRRNVLFWGRIEPYKGLSVLLDSIELVRQVDPEVQLRVVGRGRLDREFLERMTRLRVHVENRWVDHDEVRELADWAGIVALPYESATQSGPAAMALSNGVPVVATAVGALPEQVRHGRTGLVVPPRDPSAFAAGLLTIINDPKLALSMSATSLQIAATEERWSILGPRLLTALRNARDRSESEIL